MTLPGGPDDLNPGVIFGYTGNNGSISGAPERTEANVKPVLQERYYGEESGSPWRRTEWPVDQMPDGPVLWSALNAVGRGVLDVAADEIWNDLGELFAALNWVPENIKAALQRIIDIITAIVNGWTGGGTAVTDPLEVQYTIEAIKDAVINGWTVETITSSETWTMPTTPITELVVILVASGENGGDGGATRANAGVDVNGGTPGRGGSYLVVRLNPQDITEPVDVTVGVNGGSSSFGSFASVSPGALGGMPAEFGYIKNDSMESLPGRGGRGGDVVTGTSADDGANGTSSAVAAGGSGGAGGGGVGSGTAENGAAGENANPAAVTKCGGGGGGGGGGRFATAVGNFATAGAGGPGGYPGGGGGGGGAAGVSLTGGVATAGAGGLGAAGIVWVMYR